MIPFTPQLFIFDSITMIAIIVLCIMLHLKFRMLYDLSLHKGIKFLSNAMLFYIGSFGVMYIRVIYDYLQGGMYNSSLLTLPGLMLMFLNLYFAALGGFYLAYSLMWRRHEKDRIMRFHLKKVLFLNLVMITVIVADVYLAVAYGVTTPYLFFGVMISLLSYAIMSNCMHGSCKRELNPFVALVSMGLGVYLLFLVENLLDQVFFTVHYYVFALATIITLTFFYYVNKVLK